MTDGARPEAGAAVSDPEESADASGSPRGRRPLRRALIAGGVVVAAVGVVLGGTKLVIEWRDRTDPVDVDDLARSFDDESTGGSSTSGLAVGVWAYDATGTEYVDMLGGPVHEFPDEVAQTVRDTPCGQSITVQLFEQRYDTFELCRDADDRLVLDRFESRHEFVGIAEVTVTDRCEPLALWWPGIEADVGASASAACTAHGEMTGDLPSEMRREVVGIEDADVGGETVRAVRILLGSEVGTPDDPTHGTYDHELWLTLDDPVIVRRTLDAAVDAATPLGRVGFEESFELTAQSLDPR